MAKKKTTRGIGKNLAIVSLILNTITVPGFGSALAGKKKTAIYQVLLALLGGLIWIYLTSIGSLIFIAAWIWSITTGVKIVQESYN